MNKSSNNRKKKKIIYKRYQSDLRSHDKLVKIISRDMAKGLLSTTIGDAASPDVEFVKNFLKT